MTNWFATHDGLVVLGQVGVWAAALWAARGTMGGAVAELPRRGLVALILLGVLAAAISATAYPVWERYGAVGHEASYADCFLGVASPGSEQGWEPYVTYPLLRWTYWAIGGVLGRESVSILLAFSMLVRGLTVVAFGLFAHAVLRRSGGALAAAALLALAPVHAFWAATIYNVVLPLFLVVLCLWLAVIAWRAGSVGAFAAAAASGGLVVASRVEWGLLAPGLLIVLFVGLGGEDRHPGTRRAWFWGPAIGIGLAFAVSLALGSGTLTSQGGYHDPLGYLETMGRQVWILDFYAPLSGPVGVVAMTLGFWRLAEARGSGRRGRRSAGREWAGAVRLPLALVAFAALTHAGLATFNDFAHRHALLPLLPLLLLAAAALPEWGACWRSGGMGGPQGLPGGSGSVGAGSGAAGIIGALGALAVAGTAALSAAQIHADGPRYFASTEDLRAAHPGFAGAQLDHAALEAGGCYLITDNERLWGRGLAGSHFNLMEPGEAATHWRDHRGCILWLFDVSDYRLDGLAVASRSLKLLRWFDWELLGYSEFPDGLDAAVYRMTAPPWGWSAPPPGWGWEEGPAGE